MTTRTPGACIGPRLGLRAVALLLVAATLGGGGCRSQSVATGPESGGAPEAKRTRSRSGERVKGVVCLFDQKPWLNTDQAGDRDPEGIQYRVFLDGGKGKGVLHEGTFDIEMYRVSRDADGQPQRTLVSDWHYPTSRFQTVFAKILGYGYHLQLRWAKKDIAGNEIELITEFADQDGNRIRAGTKRLRVPKYTS